MAARLENFFIDSHFPAPGGYATDLDDYLSEISDNEKVAPVTRVKAAYECQGTNSPLRDKPVFLGMPPAT